MIIDFSRAAEGEFYTVDETVSLPDELTGSRDGHFVGNATLSGWYTFSDNTLAVDCALETEATFPCDRCGAPVTIAMKVPVTETFFKDAPDEYSLTYEVVAIDLKPV